VVSGILAWLGARSIGVEGCLRGGLADPCDECLFL
jgi:hypothetical protein